MACFCIPPPASLKPRKLYNLIIPDVFPDVPPGPLDPLPATVLKRIEKLTEYAERSPSKIPKISRRLARRSHRALNYGHVGHVRIAALAYTQLLQLSLPATPSFKLLMPELAEPPFQLLHRLLNYSAAPLVQVLGTELFASLAEVSTEAEHALASLHQLVPELLKLSKTEPTPAAKASAAAAAAAAAANGSIPDAPAVDVQVGALHALEKYVSLCSRLRCSPPFLSEIQGVAIHVRFPGAPTNEAAAAAVVATSATPVPGASATSKAARTDEGTSHLPASQKAAASLLHELRPFLQHSQAGVQAVESLLSAALSTAVVPGTARSTGGLDQDGVRRVALQVAGGMSGSSGMRALIRQASTPSVDAAARSTMLDVIVSQTSMPPSTVLSLMLQEAPLALQRGMAAGSTPAADAALLQAAGQLSQSTACLAAVLEVVAGVLHGTAGSTTVSGGALQSGAAGVHGSPASSAHAPAPLASLTGQLVMQIATAALDAARAAPGATPLHGRPSLAMQASLASLHATAEGSSPATQSAAKLASAIQACYTKPALMSTAGARIRSAAVSSLSAVNNQQGNGTVPVQPALQLQGQIKGGGVGTTPVSTAAAVAAASVAATAGVAGSKSSHPGPAPAPTAAAVPTEQQPGVQPAPGVMMPSAQGAAASKSGTQGLGATVVSPAAGTLPVSAAGPGQQGLPSAGAGTAAASAPGWPSAAAGVAAAGTGAVASAQDQDGGDGAETWADAESEDGAGFTAGSGADSASASSSQVVLVPNKALAAKVNGAAVAGSGASQVAAQ